MTGPWELVLSQSQAVRQSGRGSDSACEGYDASLGKKVLA